MMGQHKHNPAAIAAAKGELPPKKRERRLTKRQTERLLRLKIIRTIDPFHVRGLRCGVCRNQEASRRRRCGGGAWAVDFAPYRNRQAIHRMFKLLHGFHI